MGYEEKYTLFSDDEPTGCGSASATRAPSRAQEGASRWTYDSTRAGAPATPT